MTAYDSIRLSGGKAIARLFDGNELVDLESHAQLEAVPESGTLTRIQIRSARHVNATCWLLTKLLECDGWTAPYVEFGMTCSSPVNIA